MLLVEDDPAMMQIIVVFFEQCGYRVTATATVAEAMACFQREERWTLVISDYNLPDGNGWDFCCWVREQPGAAPPLMLMSGNFSGGTFSGMEFLAKPFDLADLKAKLTALLGSETPE